MTREIVTKKNERIIVDDDDFDVLSKYSWMLVGKGYAARNGVGEDGKKKTIYIHRQIMQAPKGTCVDHINGDKLDNRRANLRICSYEQNMANSNGWSNNATGFKGVTMDHGKYRVRVTINGKNRQIGTFCDPSLASEFYDLAHMMLNGDFSRAAR